MTSCPLKKYSDVFGKPKEGVHRYRLLDVAIVDYALTLLSAVVLSKITKIPLVLSTILVLISGILAHMLFGVQTSALAYIGIKC